MINLNAFIISLKTTWIRRMLLNDGNWSYVIKEKINLKYVTVYGEEYIQMLGNQINNKFWKDVLNSYSKFIAVNTPKSINDFLNCQIFYNKNILVDNKFVVNKYWADKNILFINDLVNKNGNLYSLQEFEHIYNIKTNFLTYHSMVTAINKYKNKIVDNVLEKNTILPGISYNIKPLISNIKGCKIMYNILNKNTESPTSQAKWKELYNIEDETWEDIYSAPFNITKHTSLQWFQYRINHRLIPTRKYLFTIKKADNPFCNSCHEEETISHMLWDCPLTKQFILQCKTVFSANNLTIPFNEELFIFNISKTATQADLQIMLEVKYYIYSTKRLTAALSIKALLNKLKFFYKAKKQIAIQKNKLDNFTDMWHKYINLLET